MLVVSLACHVCVVAGVALSYLPALSPLAATPKTPAPTTLVLHSEIAPIPPAKAKLAVVASIASTEPVAAAVPTRPKIEKLLAAGTPAPVPVQEANPNAHIAPLPPDAVLSPTPPPVLDGAKGVVFLLDISGSMYEPFNGANRLAYARQALALRLRALKDGTPFAIALYAQRAHLSGPLVAASNATREAAVRFILQDVDCGGGTNLPAGLTAVTPLRAGSIVLLSDGDLNMTAFNLMPKVRDAMGSEGHCAALTVVGIAPRVNVGADRLLQILADQQGGTYLAQKLETGAPLVTSAANAAQSATQ
jgi:hypothetical protein